MRIKFISKKQQTPDVEGGVSLSYASARRTGYRLRGYLLLAIVISPILLLAWVLLSDKIFITAPGVVTTEPREVRSSGSGFVEQILVGSGDHLIKGQLLAKLTNPVISTRITTLALQRKQLNIKWGDLDMAVLEPLEHALSDAREGRKQQSEILEQFRNATKRGIVSTRDMATVIQTYTASRLAVRAAKAELERERRKQQLEHVDNSLIQQQRALDLSISEANSQLEMLQPKASTTAVVAEILIRKGDWVEESTPLFLLTQRQKPFVLAFLDASYASLCIDGSTVTIIFPNGDKVMGKIRGQTVLARRLPVGLAKPFEADRPALKVTVEIEGNTNVALIENLPVEVRF